MMTMLVGQFMPGLWGSRSSGNMQGMPQSQRDFNSNSNNQGEQSYPPSEGSADASPSTYPSASNNLYPRSPRSNYFPPTRYSRGYISPSNLNPYPGGENPNSNSDSSNYFGPSAYPPVPPNPKTANNGTPSPGLISNDAGWNNNVNVYCSSTKDQETFGDQNSGYIKALDQGLDAGDTLTQAHDAVRLNSPQTQTPIRNNAKWNSLSRGKGGKALLVTGDGIDRAEADVFAAHLRRDEGMDVTVLADPTPEKFKEAIQQMGLSKGEQCLIGISAHGAHDDSGQGNGNIALGYQDGEANAWLHENDLKSWINQYLSPNYANVNVVLDSCYSGNFIQ